MVPNTHTNTPKLIVAKPAPTKRKHCKRTSFHRNLKEKPKGLKKKKVEVKEKKFSLII